MKEERCAKLHRGPCLRAMMLAAGLATLMLAAAGLSDEAAAQINAPPPPNSTPLPRSQLRDQAPIGHRQPRPQDLPPGVVHGENGSGGITAEERALDKKLEICRRC